MSEIYIFPLLVCLSLRSWPLDIAFFQIITMINLLSEKLKYKGLCLIEVRIRVSYIKINLPSTVHLLAIMQLSNTSLAFKNLIDEDVAPIIVSASYISGFHERLMCMKKI